MSALARHVRAALLVPLAALAGTTAAAEAPALPPGTVIEWRSPELTRARRAHDWQRQRILAIEGNAIRYREEDATDGPHGTEVTRIAHRGLVPLFFQVDQYRAERREHVARTIERYAVGRDAIAALFPLKTGARSRIMLNVESETYADLESRPGRSRFAAGSHDYSVERHETIEVPAGRFETFVILIERLRSHELESPPDTARPKSERRAERIWYAMALGWPVKRQQGLLRPDGSFDGITWHVVAIKRP